MVAKDTTKPAKFWRGMKLTDKKKKKSVIADCGLRQAVAPLPFVYYLTRRSDPLLHHPRQTIVASLSRLTLHRSSGPLLPAMSFFFNRGRSRQPADVVRSTKELLLRIQEAPSNPKVENHSASIRQATNADSSPGRRGARKAASTDENYCSRNSRWVMCLLTS